MPNLDDGTSGYLKGTATVMAYFPIDRKGVAYIACEACLSLLQTVKQALRADG